MKKFIFCKMKSEQEYCRTFSWRLNTHFLSFFGTNTFAKKLSIYAVLLLLGVGFSPASYAQLVGSSAVKANFGVDGDVYANLLQFPNIAVPPVPLPSAVATDDWFQTTYPGPGYGVIDQSQPYPVIDNTSFSRRQSVTTPTAPYPFPIVHSGPGAGADYLWLDAVYGRDNYVVGGSAEKSYFAGSGDKNSDNPTTWSIGTSGSVPQKDDLVDVFAHLRGEGIRLPDAIDPRPFTTLWAYAAASIAVTNGNKHVDFEFFRTALSTPADLNIPGKTGPDGGRTAFTFNTDGSVAIPGTIIISIDYTNGGTAPQVRIRVWMDETVFNSFDNSAPLRPFTIDKNTAFEKGTDSGTFGYAAILENVGATNIFGRVNDNASTLGPPWGTFAGSGPDAVTDFQPLQFVEIGINLTAFGLDKRGTQDPCANILGSLLVKTRSSGGGPNEGAFGSELKDFAGPFLFGNTGTPPIVSVPDKTTCADTAVNITTGATTTGGPIHYYTGSDYTGEILSPTTFAPSVTTTIYVRTESLTNPGCFGTSSFIVTVNAINPGVIAGDQTLCTPFDPAAFTSTTAGTGGGTITYQWQISTTGCAGTWSDISGATSATYNAPAVSAITNFRRVATSTLNGNVCSANSNCLTVTPNNVSSGSIAGDQTLCTPFNPAAFTSTTAGTGSGTITYQWQISTTGCAGTWSDIASATLATYDAPAVSVITNFRRVTISTVNGVPCSANSNCLTVTPNAITPGVIAGNQTICSGGNPAAFTNTTPGSGDGSITYQWQSGAGTCATATFTDIVGATSATYDVPAGLAATTSYRRVATSTVNTVPCSATSNCITVTVINVTPGTIAASQTICSGGDPAAFTQTVAAQGSNLTYQWQSGAGTCDTATFTNIVGATSVTYDVPAGLTTTTSYRRIANSTDAECPAISNCLTVTVNNVSSGSIAGDQTLCSPFNPAAFTSTTAGTGSGVITYQWQSNTTGCASTFNDIVGATSVTYDPGVISVTTYYRRITISTLNGIVCSANSNCLTVTPNNVSSGAIAGDQTLCSPFDPAAFTSTTAGTGSGTVTFKWQISTTGCDGTWSDIASATSATYDAPAVSVVTNFRRVTISTLNGVVCSANSNCLTVTPNNVSSGSVAGDQKVCIGDDPAAFTSTTAGTGSGVVTYQWQSNTTGCSAAFTDIVGATSATYDPGVASVTTYYRRVTISTLNGVICSANSNCLTVTAESCAKALCTYTQGYYGNLGGMSCAPNNGGVFGKYTTLELIERALSSYNGGTMTIGSSGNTVVITNTPADRMAIIDVLPGGGSSYALMGSYSISSLPSDYLTKKGTLNNTLLAQTITLGLNIGINGALGDFVLQAGKITTAAPEGGCGSDIPKARSCNPDGTVNNEYQSDYSISVNVVNALTDKTVQGLFDLANTALGGGSTNGLSLSEIAGAVDAINNAFDGCRIFIGYNVPKLICPVTLAPIETTSKMELAGFDAYPVPFKDVLTIKYNFDYVSDVKIEVFNSTGTTVLSKADTNSYLNKEVALNLKMNRGQEQVYVVKVTTNRGSSVKKVMSSK